MQAVRQAPAAFVSVTLAANRPNAQPPSAATPDAGISLRAAASSAIRQRRRSAAAGRCTSACSGAGVRRSAFFGGRALSAERTQGRLRGRPEPAQPPPSTLVLSASSEASAAPPEATCVVLGAGIAGLISAGLLLRHFERVLLVEKDDVEGSAERSGVPQGGHLHHLLPRGAAAMEEIFPGFFDRMAAAGAAVGDPEVRIKLFLGGKQVERPPSGCNTVFSRRPLIESVARALLLEGAGPRLEVASGTRAKSLVVDPADRRVEGAMLEGPAGLREARAALVVDCSGRNSHVGRWIERAGFPAPPAGYVDSMMQYCTRVFDPPAGWRQAEGDWDMMFARPQVPDETRIGALLAFENGQWGALMGGFDRDWAPRDVDGFLSFSRTLNHPAIYEHISRATPVGEASIFRSLGNKWFRWDMLPEEDIPAGLVQLGDSVCTFNPFYAGGMTCAALQAEALAALLATGADPRSREFAAAFYRETHPVIGRFWDPAAGTDLKFPGAVKEGPVTSGLEGVAPA